jgi:hypothetical protein
VERFDPSYSRPDAPPAASGEVGRPAHNPGRQNARAGAS